LIIPPLNCVEYRAGIVPNFREKSRKKLAIET